MDLDFYLGDKMTPDLLIGSLKRIAINDTSQAPPATYLLTASSQSTREGDTVLIHLQTTNIAEKTMLYWRVAGNGVDDNDLMNEKAQGSGAVDSLGILSMPLTFRQDEKTEGPEKVKIQFYSDSQMLTAIGNPLGACRKFHESAASCPPVPG